jgi:hypothetical protein
VVVAELQTGQPLRALNLDLLLQKGALAACSQEICGNTTSNSTTTNNNDSTSTCSNASINSDYSNAEISDAVHLCCTELKAAPAASLIRIGISQR